MGEPTRDQLLKAELTVIASQSPLPKTDIMDLLFEVKLLTASRTMDDNELKAQLEIYATKLLEFPADCVKQVLKSACNDKWWPEWASLVAKLSPYDQTRKMLLREIHKRLSINQTEHTRGQTTALGDFMNVKGQ